MSEQLFNEAEQYLLQRWKDAFQLEKQMEQTRKKYAGLCERIVAVVKEKHPVLDASRVWVTQFWGDGHIGVGRTSWPKKKNEDTCSGFWIEQVRLELLTDMALEAPTASIWVENKAVTGDMDQIKRKVRAAKKAILSKDELALWQEDNPDSEGTIFWYELPQKRQDLLAMISEGNGQKYVDCMIEHFESLARFTSALDEALLNGAGR